MTHPVHVIFQTSRLILNKIGSDHSVWKVKGIKRSQMKALKAKIKGLYVQMRTKGNNDPNFVCLGPAEKCTPNVKQFVLNRWRAICTTQ